MCVAARPVFIAKLKSAHTLAGLYKTFLFVCIFGFFCAGGREWLGSQAAAITALQQTTCGIFVVCLCVCECLYGALCGPAAAAIKQPLLQHTTVRLIMLRSLRSFFPMEEIR